MRYFVTILYTILICIICATITVGDRNGNRKTVPAIRVPQRNCPPGQRSDVNGICRLVIKV